MQLSSKMLPDFLIIGAMKSGTTSLFQYLSLHPQISMAKIKEPVFFNKKDYFNGKWGKGIKWYMRLFENNLKIKGEASTGYTKYPKDPDVAERIYSVLPEVKLIYIIRHPIARAVSHYLDNLINGRERRTIKECLLKDIKSDYINCGKYFMQLQQYLKHFDKKQIYILTTEKLRIHREKMLNEIFKFLGVNSPFFTSEFYKEHYVTKEKIRKLVSSNKIRLLKKSQNVIVRHRPQPYNEAISILKNSLHSFQTFVPYGLLLETMIKKIFVNSFKIVESISIEKTYLDSILNGKANNIIAGLSNDEYMQLENYFIDDIKQLSRFLNYEFLEWKLNFPLRSD